MVKVLLPVSHLLLASLSISLSSSPLSPLLSSFWLMHSHSVFPARSQPQNPTCHWTILAKFYFLHLFFWQIGLNLFTSERRPKVKTVSCLHLIFVQSCIVHFCCAFVVSGFGFLSALLYTLQNSLIYLKRKFSKIISIPAVSVVWKVEVINNADHDTFWNLFVLSYLFWGTILLQYIMGG